MPTATKSNRRPPPTRYFIEYADPEWHGEPSYDHAKIEDAATLQQARTLAARRIKQHDTHVGIYERFDFDPPPAREPYAPWGWEERYVEDGFAS